MLSRTLAGIVALALTLGVGAVDIAGRPQLYQTAEATTLVNPYYNDVLRDIVGWWLMEEGTGTTAADASGAGYDASFVSAPAWVTGKVGTYALDFDGTDDYLDIGDQAAHDGLDAITVTAWAKTHSSPVSGLYIVVGKYDRDISGSGWYLALYDEDSNGQFSVRSMITTTAQNAGYHVQSTTELSDDTWYHIAMTWTSTSGDSIVYINGVNDSDNLGNANATMKALDLPVLIGARKASGTPERFLDGLIDDVRIYNRTLSAAEIAAIAEGR